MDHVSFVSLLDPREYSLRALKQQRMNKLYGMLCIKEKIDGEDFFTTCRGLRRLIGAILQTSGIGEIKGHASEGHLEKHNRRQYSAAARPPQPCAGGISVLLLRVRRGPTLDT